VTTLFLGCFAFGLIFTVASFLLGALGGSHIHIPGFVSHAGAGHHGNGHATGPGHISPFNVSTLCAFLAWFGGAGYLLSRYSGFTGTIVTLFATAVGLVGGGIVFLALSRLLLPRLSEMRAEDYRVEGAVGRITSTIRRGGTGEIVYMLGGTQQIEGARGLVDEEFEKGTEVVIHHIAGGIAYVERWDKFAERNALPPEPPGPS
jgi:membrane protein implicated in regulation of membrane protease activity